jgi:zinc transport system substrate-binding protein
MMRTNRLSKIIFLCLLLMLPIILSCQQSREAQQQNNKLQVVATIFPLYDFARNIGSDKVQVSLLLPPATDAHNMELKPNDIIKISKADLFLYVNMEMEHWAYKIIKATSSNTNMLPVETGNGITMLLLSGTDEADQRSSKFDPHIWLDFDNAQKMVDNIAAAFIKKDARNGDFYRKNALEYKLRLAALDKKYREGLIGCRTRLILHAGHWAFAYLANKYNFQYIAASTVSADSEPSPQKILNLIDEVKKQHIPYVYYEDIIAPRLAQTISAETGAGLLKLYNGHGISKEDLKEGTTFLMMMEKNLTNLKLGMQCP